MSATGGARAKPKSRLLPGQLRSTVLRKQRYGPFSQGCGAGAESETLQVVEPNPEVWVPVPQA